MRDWYGTVDDSKGRSGKMVACLPRSKTNTDSVPLNVVCSGDTRHDGGMRLTLGSRRRERDATGVHIFRLFVFVWQVIKTNIIDCKKAVNNKRYEYHSR